MATITTFSNSPSAKSTNIMVTKNNEGKAIQVFEDVYDGLVQARNEGCYFAYVKDIKGSTHCVVLPYLV